MAKLTVAELKRMIRPGVQLQTVWNSTSFKPASDPHFTEVATVRRVMATQFTVTRPYKGDAESFCSFPKASELSATADGFRIDCEGDGRTVLEYRIVSQPQAAA